MTTVDRTAAKTTLLYDKRFSKEFEALPRTFSTTVTTYISYASGSSVSQYSKEEVSVNTISTTSLNTMLY